MKIAQVSPLYESVPPKLYGGTERVVSYLTEELVKAGHDVTLFASGDSVTKAELVSCCPEALRLNKNCQDQMAHQILLLEKVIQNIEEYDIIHYHIDYFHFPISRIYNRVPQITTLHGRLNIPDLVPIYKEYKEMPVVSISYSQRRPLPWLNWQGTVYHGLPVNLFAENVREGEYSAFLGRISPEKRVDRAIRIAIEAEIPLKIAAKIDNADKKYFDAEIKHLLDHPLVEYVGEINEDEKETFLGNAKCLLFPIDWPEPFGLVMIESLACGTPVIAFNNGSVSEIIDDGKTGFIVNSIKEAVKAVNNLNRISRYECRRVFEERFSAERMASDYVSLYQNIVNKDVSENSYNLTVA
jgi:glycosyltransferase involved in cell wall biosynthesis